MDPVCFLTGQADFEKKSLSKKVFMNFLDHLIIKDYKFMYLTYDYFPMIYHRYNVDSPKTLAILGENDVLFDYKKLRTHLD